MQNKLVLVDGSSYLFRAYHALPSLTNQAGEPTGALLGVMNMLNKLRDAYSDAHFAVVFDTKGKTFRHALYPAYKANRPEMPETLAVQITPLHAMIRAHGFPLIMVPGVEADDVIGTLAVAAAQRDFHVIISTGDKDMAQLVNTHVTLVNTMTGETLDRAGVKDKFSVFPEQIVDYLSLIGDKSDNVPGVPKVGPKTAAKWLERHGTLDALMTQKASLPGKVGDSFREHLNLLPLAQKLVTIDTAVDLDIDITELTCQPPQNSALKTLYTRYGFKRLLQQISNEPEQASALTPTYHIITQTQQWQQWLSRLQAADAFVIDTETTSLCVLDAEIVGVAFALSADEACYVPLAHNYSGVPQQLDRATVLQDIKPLLENKTQLKIGHNIKYDANVLRNVDIHINAPLYDTMLASYVWHSTACRHDMDSLAAYYLSRETTRYTDIAGKGVNQLRFDAIAIEHAGPYAAEDAAVTFALCAYFQQKLSETPPLAKLYQSVELPLIPILADMEYRGVLIDAALLQSQSQVLADQSERLAQEIYQTAGETLNIDSPKQLQQLLYTTLQLPILAKTPKGQPSTAESVLTELATTHPIAQQILDYRSLTKLRTTYTDKLPQQIHPKTGRIHTSFHQAVTATGRLSSSEPNLQNIPIRTQAGRAIRQAFIVQPGFKLIAADYSQIELRIMAHLSGDSRLCTAFAENADVHCHTAAEIFGVALSDVTDTQRRSAKAINFGLIYGMSNFGLAKQLGISRDAAQSYIDTYFKRYPDVQAFMTQSKAVAHQQGYVETILGRRLYIPDIHSRHYNRRQAAERAAINAPMQGSAADIIKLAMLALDYWIKTEALTLDLLVQVHDELIFSCPEEEVCAHRDSIKQIMASAFALDVPLDVSVGIGQNWDEAH